MLGEILFGVCLMLLFMAVPLLLLVLSNKYLPRWFCDNFGHWHLAPKSQTFDGCSAIGNCPRCGRRVMQDGQGNWF